MSTVYVQRFETLGASSAPMAGGKGASLGELVHAGAPVPPGCVVTRNAFDAFLASADPDDRVRQAVAGLDAGDLSVADAAARIAGQLGAAPVPAEVAAEVLEAFEALGCQRISVRSSATCEDSGANAWAGQLETFLNVTRPDVLERVRSCWISIFSHSALSYGAAHGYGGGEFAVAVVLQQMVDSEISGIGFSVHPVTQDPDVVLIEACLGLGEAIVSGEIAPDQYSVERGTREILDRSVGHQKRGLYLESGASEASWRALGEQGAQPKLTDGQVRDYARLLEHIADHYGLPMDTEWAIQDGGIQVLQARPITTLAEEYDEQVVDPDTEWQLVVRRPMSLFEVSIWSHWLDSAHAGESLGIHSDRALSIQDEAGMANDFLSKPAMQAGLAMFEDMLRKDRALLLERLHHGQALASEARSRLERGPEAFGDLEEASAFFIDVAQHTTTLPAWTLIVGEQTGIEDPEIRGIAEELRSRTFYPAINREILDPLVEGLAKKVGFSAPQRASDVTTWSEIREGRLDRDLLESRLDAVHAGRRFVYQCLPEGEQVRFVSQGGYLVMRLAPLPADSRSNDPDVIRGQAAWPGVHRGRARVILSPDAVGQTLEDGEVLVSIQSSPALMPLLRRCGAIVSDDGGINCHAAIICRELKKPTLIGTGSTTSRIHTGDLVEVDTYAQEVRILERVRRGG